MTATNLADCMCRVRWPVCPGTLRLPRTTFFASCWPPSHQLWITASVRAISYLQAENHVLREQLSDRRIQFTDPQRIRLAKRAKELGRKASDVVSVSAACFASTIATLRRLEMGAAGHRARTSGIR